MWAWSTELISFIAVTLLSAFIIKWWKCRNLPPGPWGLPFLGYLPWLNPEHPYLTLTTLSEKYGPIYSLQMGNILAVVISEQKIIRQAFNNDVLSGRADLYLAHGIMQGHGIIGAQGPLWKEQRKFAISCLKNLGATKFGSKRDKLEALILSGVENFTQKLTHSYNSNSVGGIDIIHPLLHCLGNIMNRILFGRMWEEDDPVWLKLQYYGDEGLKKMGEAGVINFLPYLRFIPKYKAAYKFVVDGLQASHAIYQEIIDQHNGDEDDVIAAFLKERILRGDNHGNFTDKQLHFLLADLFGAGVDTTVSSVSWFLILVARYPDIQSKIHKEMDDLCGDGMPKIDDMSRLHYLAAAIAESQRFRTVVPMGVPHGAIAESSLDSYVIPNGAMIVPLQWAVHMNPNVWPEPHIYKPERFLNEHGEFYKHDSFIPFQTGKRMCLGEEFGKIMLFLFASTILKRFTVKLPEDSADHLEGVFDILLKPKDAHIMVTPRKRLSSVISDDK